MDFRRGGMTEGFVPGDDAWRGAFQALESVLDEAVARADVQQALADKRIDVTVARRAVRDNKAVQARFREEHARRGAFSLAPDDDYVYTDFDDYREPLTPQQIAQVAVIFMVGVGYLSLIRAAWAAMPVATQVFAVAGFVGMLASSLRWWIAAVPSMREFFGLAPEQAAPVTRRQYMLTVVVLPELWEFINGQRKPLYDTVLTAKAEPALYVEDDAEIIVTGAARQLQRILARAESGAVALAGPRGSGKTTAILAVSRGLLNDPVKDKPPLAIQSSAPARYDARDFVLHLHALLCNAILARLSPRFADSTPDGRERRAMERRGKRLRWFRRGVVLVVLLAAAVTTGRFAWGAWPFERLWRTVQQLPQDLPGEDITVLAVSAVAALYGVWVAGGLVFAGLNAIVRRLAPRRAPRDVLLLVDLAQRQLERIRFLQTYTTGWSGKFSTPLSGEAARTWSAQRAEQRPTYPEVVEEFRRFAAHAAQRLRTLGSHDRLVISIDELDKIGEPERAHEFVNDVKGIFGVPGCLFLVSVSDDALTTFERRGIAVRDAFDSAFSEMVQVGYFDITESRGWIARRALDVPEQFSSLCHVLSGGLPRDLRRHVIEMFDLAADLAEPRLAAIARLLVRRELDRKAHAFAGTARTLDDSPALSDLMADLVTIRQTADVAGLVRLANRLVQVPDGDAAHPIGALRRQSGCFVLFCATILELFTDALGEQDLIGIDALAIARQQMAVDSQIAWRLLVKFRQNTGPAD
ncbi:hypothetical protein [Actinocrispum sp. NPDC049592]|uniref:hypothetical protein n=1 Tax=Actinocrispum sp. NPDC049592 TaxID=3154835 RepID=UPI003420DD50